MYTLAPWQVFTFNFAPSFKSLSAHEIFSLSTGENVSSRKERRKKSWSSPFLSVKQTVVWLKYAQGNISLFVFDYVKKVRTCGSLVQNLFLVLDVTPTVSVKMVGTLWGLLVPSMLVYKIWWPNRDKQLWEGRGEHEKGKNSVWLRCPNYFCLRLCRGGIWRRVDRYRG